MALDARAFTAFERKAHDRIAETYAKHFAPVTALALRPLLDAAQVVPGRRVLAVASGPGMAAVAASARGAAATGVDVSPRMVALAKRAHPGVVFRVADVVTLPFMEDVFDAVVCNFALGQFPEPDAALAERVRILAPSGALAFSWWDRPERQRVQGLFREAIAELGMAPPLEVPQGHDTLRFSDPDPDAFARLLRGAGLDGARMASHRTTRSMPDINVVWQAGMGGMAVTASAVAA